MKTLPLNQKNWKQFVNSELAYIDEKGMLNIAENHSELPDILTRVVCDKCHAEFYMTPSNCSPPHYTSDGWFCTNPVEELGVPFEGVTTVAELIVKLEKLPPDLPILGTYIGSIRQYEYADVSVEISNLDAQEAGGDPMYYGMQNCALIVVG